MSVVTKTRRADCLRAIHTLIFAVLAFGALSSCGKNEETTLAVSESCTLTSSSWSPSVSGVQNSNHDSNVEIIQDIYTVENGPLTGLEDPVTSDREIAIAVDMTSDLGVNGSLSLVAQPTGFPSEELNVGSAFPLLVSLHDGQNELVNLSKSGSGGDCAQSGFFSCNSDGICSENSNCKIQSPSAFQDRRHWAQYQIGPNHGGYASSNVFPTCNWSGESIGCAFGDDSFFSGGKLRTGIYIAKYVLLTSNYSKVTGYTGGLKVTALRKRDNTAVTSQNNGAIDLNVILVGSENISDSKTDKGQQNLNALFEQVFQHYNQSGVGIRIGKINAFEWGDDCGEGFANVDVTNSGEMFRKGSASLSAEFNAKALNIFLVSSLPASGLEGTILGVAGAINGPMINGTGKSGLAFSSFNQLDSFNPDCNPGSACTESLQESQFVDMASTISHEIGHYLGLNHPSEKSAAVHDPVPDTPECAMDSGVDPARVTHSSCLTGVGGCSASCPGYNGSSVFCPTAPECQFNHVMWYSTKNYSELLNQGDGNIFSSHSSVVLNYNPLVR